MVACLYVRNPKTKDKKRKKRKGVLNSAGLQRGLAKAGHLSKKDLRGSRTQLFPCLEWEGKVEIKSGERRRLSRMHLPGTSLRSKQSGGSNCRSRGGVLAKTRCGEGSHLRKNALLGKLGITAKQSGGGAEKHTQVRIAHRWIPG